MKWWRSQIRVVLRARTTPRRGRCHLLSLDVPGGIGGDWPIWQRIAPSEFRLHTAEGDLWFSARGINGDRGAFGEIFVAHCYLSDYRNAVVVDIGAHKGYFGAYAF